MEERQRAKREIHHRGLMAQIEETVQKREANREEEKANPQNELFPKIEEPPIEETL